MENPKEDDSFYRELHQASRSYDQSLWTIPSVFFAVTGLVLGLQEKIELNAIKLVFLILVIFFQVILIFQFYKTHFYTLSVQKRIDEYDKKFNESEKGKNGLSRFPFGSMNDKALNKRIYELQMSEDDPTPLSCIQTCIIKQRLSKFMKCGMWLVVVCFSILFLYEFWVLSNSAI